MTRHPNGSQKNRQKTPKIWGVFWRFFCQPFGFPVAESAQKWFYQWNNVKNVFSNIELPLGYNIMTLEYVLERTGKEIAQNTWKKSKIPQIWHFFLGGGLATRLYDFHTLSALWYFLLYLFCSGFWAYWRISSWCSWLYFLVYANSFSLIPGFERYVWWYLWVLSGFFLCQFLREVRYFSGCFAWLFFWASLVFLGFFSRYSFCLSSMVFLFFR